MFFAILFLDIYSVALIDNKISTLCRYPNHTVNIDHFWIFRSDTYWARTYCERSKKFNVKHLHFYGGDIFAPLYIYKIFNWSAQIETIDVRFDIFGTIDLQPLNRLKHVSLTRKANKQDDTFWNILINATAIM